MNPTVKSYLSEKYGFKDELSERALQDAQTQAHDVQFMNAMNRAGTTIGAAIAGTRPDYSFNQEMSEMAQAPVKDLMARRKAQADDLNYQNAQINTAEMRDARDPNSRQSQTLRKAWEKSLPGIEKAYGDDWQHVTAADGNLILKPLEFREQLDSRRQLMQAHLQRQTDERQDRAMSETVDLIERSKSRGMVKNAWEAERLVDNAKEILNAYPDLNKMPQQQVVLLVDELGKIARGGAATEGSQHALMPNTVTSNFMSGLAKLKNSPQGAQLGEFIKGYGHYLDDLKSNARNVIGQSIKSTLVGHKHRLRQSDHDTIAQNYSDYLEASNRSPASKPKPSGRLQVSNGKESLYILPQDLEHAQRDGYTVVKEVAHE